MTELPARFWAKTREQDTGYKTPCLIWTAYKLQNGYGRFGLNGKTQYAHRVAYEAAHGPIPEGLFVDHLCRVRACVNAGHLEAVTNRENLLRGQTIVAANARKTHCPQGHEYSPENTRIRIWRGRAGRHCLTCMREQRAARAETERARREPKELKTRCGKGHPFDEANTYVNPQGRRSCWSCAAVYSLRYKARRREGPAA